MDEAGGCGVEAREDAVQKSRAAKYSSLAELFAQKLVAWRRREESIEQCAKIEAGAASDDGEMVALTYAVDGLAREAAVVSGGAGSVWRKNVDEVMGDAGALGQRGLGGADLHAAIDGDRIATDDLA